MPGMTNAIGAAFVRPFADPELFSSAKPNDGSKTQQANCSDLNLDLLRHGRADMVLPFMSTFRSLLRAASDVEKRMLVGVVLVTVFVLGFGLLASEVVEGDTKAFDERLLQFFRAPTNPSLPVGPPWLKEAMRDVTALGGTSVLTTIVVGVAGYLAVSGLRHAALMVLGSVALGVLLSNLLKAAFSRPRPFIPPDLLVFTASFPSGHATLSAVVYLTLGALLCRTQSSLAVKTYILCFAMFLTGIVGLSRIYLGVHWPTDVVAGWLVGGTWALLCWLAMIWLQGRGEVEAERAGP